MQLDWLDAAIIAWLIFVSVYDLATWEVPAWATWSVILATCVYRGYQGAWAPLILFLLYFVWDTTWADLKRPWVEPEPGDEERWLLPSPVPEIATLVLVGVAAWQGPKSLIFTLLMALAHQMWRMKRLAGGDAALLIALAGVFPRGELVISLIFSIIVWTFPRLLARYWRDLLTAARMLVVAGPPAAMNVMLDAVQQKAQPSPIAYIFGTAGIMTALLT